VEEVTDEPLYRDRVCGIDIGKARRYMAAALTRGNSIGLPVLPAPPPAAPTAWRAAGSRRAPDGQHFGWGQPAAGDDECPGRGADEHLGEVHPLD